MSARFAILQSSLEVPPVARLRAAFRSVKCLTDSDAHTLANDAFGILVKNLVIEDAMTLQGALRAEDVETSVVMQTDLPQLPAIKFVRRLDYRADAMMVYDAIGRAFPVPWAHVMLLAAGSVRSTVFERKKTTRAEQQTSFGRWTATRQEGGALDETYPEYTSREKLEYRRFIEIVLARSAMRFQADADTFQFDYLADRRGSDLLNNLALLVRDIAAFAPHTMLNRGAYFLREDPPAEFPYPSKNAFYEEMTWMLWRAANAQAA